MADSDSDLKEKLKQAIRRNREGSTAISEYLGEILNGHSIGVVLGLLETAGGTSNVSVQIVRTETETVLTLKQGKQALAWSGPSLANCIADLCVGKKGRNA